MVVVPVKTFDVAKSRLGLGDDERRAVARAVAADLVAAAVAVAVVARVVVVTDERAAADDARRLGAVVLADAPRRGLRPALEHGLREAGRGPGRLVARAVLPADLPLLRAPALARALHVALEAAGPHGTALLRDRAGHREPRCCSPARSRPRCPASAPAAPPPTARWARSTSATASRRPPGPTWTPRQTFSPPRSALSAGGQPSHF